MSQWLWLQSSGKVSVLPHKSTPPLDVMQSHVGGYVERLQLGHGCTLWCNEDGLGMGLPKNELAVSVARTVFDEPYPFFLAGDCLLEVRGQRGKAKP